MVETVVTALLVLSILAVVGVASAVVVRLYRNES